MDDTSVLARMPLADAVFRAWRYAADEAVLSSLYDRHRGRGYERALRFPVLVQLVADALLISDASGRESFSSARDGGELPVSIQSAYGKLRRLPPEVSEAFLAETTRRLQQVWPNGIVTHELPTCFRDLDVLILDGKTVKGLHRRLKPVRGARGGVVGGKALVAMDLRSGMVVAMQTHLDGEANEVLLTPALTQAVRQSTQTEAPRSESTQRRRLWIGDRAFSYVQQALLLSEVNDVFLVRRRKDITFERDVKRAIRKGTDENNRPYEETWGWLGKHGMPRAISVRRITMTLPDGKDLDLITNLLDGDAVPACDALSLYRKRWRIERVFQEVTQVFGLKRLIGSTPQASLFQFAICLLVYNTLQLVRAHLAAGTQQTPATISTEKLFRDVRRQLSAWVLLIGATSATAFPISDAAETKAKLEALLQKLWRSHWARSPTQTRRTSAHRKKTKSRTHESAQKRIQNAKNKKTTTC